MTNIQRIAELNDKYRKSLGVPGVPFVFTSGISALPVEDRSAILEKVKTFNDFNEGNDPYGEHDFGSFEYEGNVINWKIDYYNPQMNAHSEDPADPSKTVRALTVMLAEEY